MPLTWLQSRAKPLQTTEQKWLANFIARWDMSGTAGRVELMQEIVERVAEERVSRETVLAAKHVVGSK